VGEGRGGRHYHSGSSNEKTWALLLRLQRTNLEFGDQSILRTLSKQETIRDICTTHPSATSACIAASELTAGNSRRQTFERWVVIPKSLWLGSVPQIIALSIKNEDSNGELCKGW